MEIDNSKIRIFKHFDLFPQRDNLIINEYNGETTMSERDLIDIKERIHKEILNEDVTTPDGKIKIERGEDYKPRDIECKALFLPSANYSIIKPHLIKGYKILLNSTNYDKIRRVFLVGQSSLTIKSAFFISGYSYYKSIFGKEYAIDHQVYNDIFKNEELKKYFEKFDQIKYTFSTFIDDNGTIKEKKEEIIDSIEDQDFIFDIHIAFLNLIFDNKTIYEKHRGKNNSRKVMIVPIWINENVKDTLNILSKILVDNYMTKDENFFIFTSNMTYFGRYYNYYTDNKEFKSRSFLKDKNNKERIINSLKILDDDNFYNRIKKKSVEELIKLDIYPFSKNLKSLIIHMFDNLDKSIKRKNEENKKNNITHTYNLDTEKIYYNDHSLDFIDSDYEINLITYMSIVIFNN